MITFFPSLIFVLLFVIWGICTSVMGDKLVKLQRELPEQYYMSILVFPQKPCSLNLNG